MTSKIREIRIEGNVAYVPLTRGYEAIIDADDADMIGRWNWGVFPRASVSYATRKIAGMTTYMHRIILDPPPGFVVDHIDRNGLNNRRSNLRICTQSQNLWNSRAKITNTSGVKGVHWDKSRDKWVARIKISYTSIFLGRFDTLEEASQAYAKARDEMHGEFSVVR